MLLPRKVGPFTLMRKLDADGISESFVAILDDPPGKQVVARRILPVVTRDPVRTSQLKARVGDLRAAQHPTLVPLMSVSEADGDLYVIEEWSDGVDLDAIVNYCVAHKTTVPHNVFLNLATQVCNALEALHARPGAESGSENVLHLALTPKAMWVTVDGRVTVGRYGLSRSPTAIATSATGTLPVGVEYLAPEQTHQDQKLTPASDIFALGSILYELLTLKAMFRAESSLQTIHRVRRAEVTTQLLEVKEIMPGLDKVLFRALSLNPRHRYQRAFVLREDLRGLMAGYSFNDIETVTRAFLSPIIRAKAEQGYEESPAGAPEQGGDTTGFLLPSRPPSRPDPRSSDRLSVTELPRAGEGPAEHTDALLADISEPISQLFPEPGRPAYDADTADTSRRQGFESLPKADEEETNIREGGTGWIKREPRPPEPEPVRKPLTPIQTSFSSRPASHESTQSLLEDTGIHDTLPVSGESTQPTPPSTGGGLAGAAAGGLAVGLASAGIAARRPSETRTVEVIGEGLDAPQKSKMQPPARTAEPLAQARKPEPKTHGATLLPEAELQPPREHTRTLELDSESKSAVTGKPSSADQWNEVPTASKHFSDLSSLPEPAGKSSPKPPETVRLPAEASKPPEAPAKPAQPQPNPGPGVASKPAERPRSTPQPAEQKPQPAQNRASGQRSTPPPAKPAEPPSKQQELAEDEQPSRPPWLPIAAGAVVLGLSLAVCTGLGAGIFFGLTGGAVAVNNNLQSEEELIAMAQPPVEPAPQPQIAAIDPAPVPPLPLEPVVEPEPAVQPEPAVVQPEPVAQPEPAPSVRPQPEPVALSTIQPKPVLPQPAPPPPKPPAPTKPPVSKISSQQQPAEIHKAMAAPAPAPAPSGTSSAPAVAISEIDRWADAAFKGELSPGATQQLAAVPQSDPGYTRARTLLYLDAKARGDNATRDAHLGAMMMLPENKYNPVLLVEKAMIAVERQDWQTALKSSQTAEQHWARIPSELIFSRKAMIYEIEAVSNTGLFYGSAGEDQDRLLQAIRGWERYQNHVRSMNRADLTKRAEENLNKLYEIQRRLE